MGTGREGSLCPTLPGLLEAQQRDSPFCSPRPHRWVQHSGGRRQAAHETLPGRAQPPGPYLLPPHSPACPSSCILEPPPGGKASCIGPIHGRCQGWACPPPPCSTMRGALCRAGVPGTSRQGKEAGASLDQVGTLSTSDQEHFPSPRGLPPLVWGCPLLGFLPFLPVCYGTTLNAGALANGHRLQQLWL